MKIIKYVPWLLLAIVFPPAVPISIYIDEDRPGDQSDSFRNYYNAIRRRMFLSTVLWVVGVACLLLHAVPSLFFERVPYAGVLVVLGGTLYLASLVVVILAVITKYCHQEIPDNLELA